ncbi:acyl carrier protein [Pantoea stewartii]|uniref:Meromycolate extension acyl carrier protein (ACP) n=2 Tax=Pantoea stewartii subsp. stewartii DC283 TaxID=660596 RepID=C7E4U6_PANSE|nr:acyl carrier protein [Pantoea stewartii]ACT68043.1 meromycolate extension acyl carrier protein (ACP) [Pantoea stewartii subsp. stewartii DC283]
MMSNVVVDNHAESLVTNLIYQVNGVLPKNISLDHSLVNDLLMDSIEMIDLLMRLEEIGVALHEYKITSELTVGDIVKHVAPIY